MLRGRIAASVLAAAVVASPAAPALAATHGAHVVAASRARADDTPTNPDPCPPIDKGFCQQVPEAPNPLLYPAAGSAALILFLALERRRRNRNNRTRA
jgi:hypothetical protein